MNPAETLNQILLLREEASYLLSPFRRTGPSCWDEDVQRDALAKRAEAERLSEVLFYATAPACAPGALLSPGRASRR